jgi:DNA-binding SARP family transcriptional activator
MRFRILGPLEVKTGEDWVSIGAAKWRAVLASLLLRPGQVVSTAAIPHAFSYCMRLFADS